MKKQRILFGALSVVTLFAIAGCSRTSPFTPSYVQPDIAPVSQPVTNPAPFQPENQNLEIPGFVDPVALGQLSDSDKIVAANAQFYALQFGRPGAPRVWAGQNNVSGNIVVGPYVELAGQTCREFKHTIIVDGDSRAQEGTSCRQANGNWVISSI